ncbi:Phospholipase-B 81 (PLB) [Durusdinium trenchii]|uniref:Phospholipase B-like n=1 Tax=Durusdinium trenchii TaxID=1381693 RepID=A0ABP0LJ76_9DINO
MVEGFLTAAHIDVTVDNVVVDVFKAPRVPEKVQAFMDAQEKWVRGRVARNNGRDPFFRQVGLLMKQYDGLRAGYAAQVPHVRARGNWAFQLLNGVGDFFDIIPAVDRSSRVDWLKLSREEAEHLHARSTHCSALVKVTPDYSELLYGHSSWWRYSNTNRIMKHYRFAFSDPSTAAQEISFSSYPGYLESLDDFYMLGSGIGWTQTSLAVMNHSLYDDHVKPESLLAWQRVRVASAMAHTAPEWAETFAKEASGTYSNQYMIIDFKLFEPKQPLPDDLFWVVEEVPGMVVAKDQTERLRQGYFSSYNIPFYPSVYDATGYPEMRAKHGTFWTFDLNVRAMQFRRDQGKVRGLDGLKEILRYNDFEKDALSFDGQRQNPLYAICSRGDLSDSGAASFGCYDTKVTNDRLVKNLQAEILNGPTRSHSLPTFSWSQFPKDRHEGLPQSYEFGFISTRPTAVGPSDAAQAEE